jgi:hypothetical protein
MEQAPELGAKENPRMVKEEEDVNLLSLMIQSVTDTVMHREIILLSNEMIRYRQFISARMLACEERLQDKAKLENFSEAFTEGWKTWKHGDEEETFHVFSTIMLN